MAPTRGTTHVPVTPRDDVASGLDPDATSGLILLDMTRAQAAYLGSYLLSLLGNGIAAIALPLLLLTTTGSALGAGALAAATAIPSFVVGLLVGVVVDRVNRRDAGIVSDLISAAAIASLPLIAMATDLNLGWFIAAGVIGSLGDIPGLTAREAMLGGIVRSGGMSKERLIATREAISAVALIIGPALAGVLIVALDGVTVLWVTAATSASAALLSLLIPRAAGRPQIDGATASAASGWQSFREGWRVLMGSTVTGPARRFLPVITGVTLAMAAVIAASQGLLLPVHLVSIGEEGALGFVLTALAAGSLVGAGSYAALGVGGRRRVWFVAALLGTVVGFWTIGLLGPIWQVLLGAGVVGLSTGVLGSLTGVLMLERIPDAARGRVLGTQNALLSLTAPAGIVLASTFTGLIDVGTAAIIVMALWTVVVLVALALPATRHLTPQSVGTPSAPQPVDAA